MRTGSPTAHQYGPSSRKTISSKPACTSIFWSLSTGEAPGQSRTETIQRIRAHHVEASIAIVGKRPVSHVAPPAFRQERKPRQWPVHGQGDRIAHSRAQPERHAGYQSTPQVARAPQHSEPGGPVVEGVHDVDQESGTGLELASRTRASLPACPARSSARRWSSRSPSRHRRAGSLQRRRDGRRSCAGPLVSVALRRVPHRRGRCSAAYRPGAPRIWPTARCRSLNRNLPSQPEAGPKGTPRSQDSKTREAPIR